MDETNAQMARRKLTELGDNFSDECLEAGMRLLTPGERERFTRLLRRAGRSRWLSNPHEQDLLEALHSVETEGL